MVENFCITCKARTDIDNTQRLHLVEYRTFILLGGNPLSLASIVSPSVEDLLTSEAQCRYCFVKLKFICDNVETQYLKQLEISCILNLC